MSSTSNFPSSHALQSGRPTCNLLKSCKPVFTPFSLESSTCLPLLDYSHQRKPLASCISSLKSPSPDTLSFVHFSSWQILKSLICVLYLFYGHCCPPWSIVCPPQSLKLYSPWLLQPLSRRLSVTSQSTIPSGLGEALDWWIVPTWLITFSSHVICNSEMLHTLFLLLQPSLLLLKFPSARPLCRSHQVSDLTGSFFLSLA